MLGKKTGVLFTISSVNFELKQGNEYIDPCSSLRLSLPLSRALSLSLSLCHLNSSVLVFNSKLVIIVFPFFINLI